MDNSLESRLKTQAGALGFDSCGIASTRVNPIFAEKLVAFVELGYHGDMTWLSNTVDRRKSAKALWPDSRTAIMVGVNYAPTLDPLSRIAAKERGVISVYALGGDYHDVIKPKLKTLASWLVRETGAEVKVFVDTAPLMEKPLAELAGIGWQGKHTNLVSRQWGSWLFLGAILTTAELLSDAKEVDHCGTCRACLDICPTRAFPAPYQLDARRCISYLTIEHKGHIPPQFREAIGNRIYGCDDCLAICPWNKFARAASELKFLPRAELLDPPLTDFLLLDNAGFRRLFAGSPIKRLGRDRFVRNVLIAVGNAADAKARPHILALVNDKSPLVRAMVPWALARVAGKEEFSRIRAERMGVEYDPDVLSEWA